MSECERCAESLENRYAYCTLCGSPTGYKPPEGGLYAAIKWIGVALMLLCTVMLFFEVYAILWGFGDIWVDIGSSGQAYILILTPSPALLTELNGIAANLWYLFIVITAIASFVMLLYTSRDGFRNILKKNIDKIDDMPLYGVVTLFAAAIAFNLIFNMLVMAAGSDPSVPGHWGPHWGEWYHLLTAAVWEEILCRVLMIGAPIMVLGLLMKKKGSWRCLLGRFEMDGAAVAFIVISSAIFAYAHLAGWDIFKIIPTFVVGLALGYLFVKYGIHAAIMLHLLTNYMTSLIWILGDDTGEALLVLFMLTIVMFGLLFLVIYGIRAARFMRTMVSEAQEPPETVP
ncbi:MAG: CPBP family intramembrane metalloprotease [Methanomassiliicoccaceae archaeon]|nr:CPBP family intramembrane metalloprotease [Methanomassiliicoccaceae archaeon]